MVGRGILLRYHHSLFDSDFACGVVRGGPVSEGEIRHVRIDMYEATLLTLEAE